MVKPLVNWILKHKYLVIILNLILVMSAASGMRFLQFTNDYRVFFSGDFPQLVAFEKLQATYTKNDNVMIAIAPRDGDVFTPKTLAALEWLTEQSWQVPYSIRVDSITNYQHTYSEEDDLIVEDLITDAESLSSQTIAKIKQIAIHEPLLVHRLISDSGHVAGVNVTIQLPDKNLAKEGPEVVAFVRDLKQQLLNKFPDIDVYLTGIVMMNNAFPEASQADMKTLVPGMFLAVILLLGIMLRVISGTFGIVVVILLSIIAAMGFTGWLGIRLTPPSASAPTIILTLAVANSVHVLINFLHYMRDEGMDKYSAMQESLRINLQPIFLTSLTTAIGFLSMNFSDAPPFRDLGNMVAMGVGMAFILSVTLLPALMMILPVRVKQRKTQGGHFMAGLANFVIAQRTRLMWGMSIIIIVLVAFIPKNELNDEFIKYFDESIDFRTDTDFVVNNMTGLYTIEYSLAAGEPGGVSDPAFLDRVEAFANWMRDQPEVLHVNTITDVMKRLNKNLHGDDPAMYSLPDSRELAAQYLLLYEMSLPFGLDLNNQIDIDKSATRFTVTMLSLSTNQILSLEERANNWLKTNAPKSMQVTGSSPSIMFAHIGARNVRSMLIGTTVALILISFILMIALRSFKIGLISMVPNLVPAAMGFGLWGLLVGEVGLALSVVAGMTIGIVVDDTVHFLSKYLRARRERNMGVEDAVRYAFSTVGMALWVTSLVLIVGFMVLTLSAFKLNSAMGLLTAITIGFALLADFLFLPPLLMKADKDTPMPTTGLSK